MSRVRTALAVVLGVLLLAAPAYAQIEAVGGVTYNTYSMDKEADKAFKSGLGLFGGVQYWISDAIAVGAQVESLSSGEAKPDPNTSGRFTGLGFLATATYHVAVSDAFFARPFLAAGVYRGEAEFKMPGSSFSLETSPSFGAKLGVQVGTDLTSSLALNGVVGYRFVSEFKEKESKEKLDGYNISGLTVGGGLTYRF